MSTKKVFTLFTVLGILVGAFSSCEKDDDLIVADGGSDVSRFMVAQADSIGESAKGLSSLKQEVRSGPRVNTYSVTLRDGNEVSFVNLGRPGSYSQTVVVKNLSSSKTDLNVKIIGTPTITIWGGEETIITWNDIRKGTSKTYTSVNGEWTTAYSNIKVRLENDGWFWQKDIPVYAEVTYSDEY